MKKISYLFSFTFLILIFITFGSYEQARADTYKNFEQLHSRETPNVDYQIITQDRGSSTSILAIHGGSIERETSEVASAVASQGGYDFYSFVGLKPRPLHITSTHFDEPIACSMVAQSDQTLSIHGCYGTQKAVTNLGGRDNALGQKVKQQLESAGFSVVRAPGNLGGRDPDNICNRNREGAGVQLELSTPLRNQLFQDKDAFDRYVTALLKAL
ncbi:MAG TPA: poly-gamma-glutamate hydrolase family protein [Syntrophomonadaceae bacterium]|nr:poly-gamma-glutamate hydrolase family protein [Syntrophomonadaceae bacterium]